MLRILQLEEIERKLLEVSALIDSRKDPLSNFISKSELWLEELDGVLQKNRLAISGTVAGLRGLLFSTKNGALYQNIQFRGRPTLRKRLDAIATDIVNQAVNIVRTTINSDRVRINEAERVALQVLAIARVYGLIDEGAVKNGGPQFAQNLITAMKSNEATVQGVVQLEGLLGKTDAIIVIDRFLNYG